VRKRSIFFVGLPERFLMVDKGTLVLPDLLLFEHFKGIWENYLTALHECYYEDFVDHTPFFEGIPIRVRRDQKYNGMDLTFWHLISEGNVEDDRIPDMRRCERIRWPRRLIECDNQQNVRIWQNYRTKKNQQEERIVIALDDFSYVVVLAKAGKGYKLITAYCVEMKHRQNKLKKEYEDYLTTKKGGFAL